MSDDQHGPCPSPTLIRWHESRLEDLENGMGLISHDLAEIKTSIASLAAKSGNGNGNGRFATLKDPFWWLLLGVVGGPKILDLIPK